MIGYIVKLTNKKDEGWFSMWGNGGPRKKLWPIVTPDKSLAQKFPDEQRAEDFINKAVRQCKINREEFIVEAVAWDRTAEFRLGADESSPSLAVCEDEKDNSLYMFVSEGGEEVSHTLPSEVADVLARFILRLKESAVSGKR